MKQIKNSTKRQQILEVFQNGDLLTANEVCEKLTDIDRATIYRNINLLASLGTLREVNIKKGITSYEIQHEDDFHQHFVCDDCEKIIPFDVDLTALKKLIPSSVSFEQFELNLRGKCEECI